MHFLPSLLHDQKYKRIKFRVTTTQHLMIKAKINGVKGNFILDTGASNSCVGLDSVEKFQLNTEESQTKAAGAGATGMLTRISQGNKLQLRKWKHKNFDLVIFDLSHVNEALKAFHTETVQGIIGADILICGKGIIDYYNHSLYLR
jgi:predicted aspartyl protease